MKRKQTRDFSLAALKGICENVLSNSAFTTKEHDGSDGHWLRFDVEGWSSKPCFKGYKAAISILIPNDKSEFDARIYVEMPSDESITGQIMLCAGNGQKHVSSSWIEYDETRYFYDRFRVIDKIPTQKMWFQLQSLVNEIAALCEHSWIDDLQRPKEERAVTE